MHFIFCTNMRLKLVTFCTLLFSTNNTIQNTLCKYCIHEEKFYTFLYAFAVASFLLKYLNYENWIYRLRLDSHIFCNVVCHTYTRRNNQPSIRLSCIFVHAQIENPKFVSQIIIKRVFSHPFPFSLLLHYTMLFSGIFCLLSRWYGTEALHLQFKQDENTQCIFYRRFYDWMKLNSWADRIVSKFKYSIQFVFF